MSRWEGYRAAAPSLRSPKGALTHHSLRERWYPSLRSGTCALRGGYTSCGKRQAAACARVLRHAHFDGASLLGSIGYRALGYCSRKRCSEAEAGTDRKKRNREVMELGDLPHGIEDCQPWNGTLRRGGVRLHELQPIVQRLRRRAARLYEKARACLAAGLSPTSSSTGMV